ncbi:hypothetical protein Tco_0952475 [Tanacetum coccineum]|uniref:RNA-directed DNA polymerase, eukaryota n=1 Tax=Tanacetum coccineum TaxID=301880 RepID=A0ABQ5DX27_9ASTR
MGPVGFYDEKADSLRHEHTQNLSPNEKENSSDPFNLYNLLNKRDKGEANSGLDSSIPFPPGFTPERDSNMLCIRRLNDCHKRINRCRLVDLRSKLCHINKVIDQGGVNDDILLTRLDLLKKLHDIKSSDARDYMQKAKIQWAIEGDENSKKFHGIINRKRANLAIKSPRWPTDVNLIYNTYPKRLSSDQLDMLESPISKYEVRNAVWGCGENKSPGPDGFTFEFYSKFRDNLYEDLIFCAALWEWFFRSSSFSRGWRHPLSLLSFPNKP